MKLRTIVAAAAMLAAQLALSVPASAADVTFTMRNNHPNALEVELYSQDRDHVWPGNNQVYVIDDGNVHDYALECNSGEKICYGAWLRSDSSSYWGSGYGGEQRCDSCCFTCDGGPTNVMVLNR